MSHLAESASSEVFLEATHEVGRDSDFARRLFMMLHLDAAKIPRGAKKIGSDHGRSRSLTDG